MDRDGNSENEAAIRGVIESWTAAVRRKDIERILENHSPDIVMFDVPPPFQSRGIDAYRQTWDMFFSWSSDPIPFEVIDMSVSAGSDVAFVVATMRCAEPGIDGRHESLDFRLTVGLRKIGGRSRRWGARAVSRFEMPPSLPSYADHRAKSLIQPDDPPNFKLRPTGSAQGYSPIRTRLFHRFA